MKKALSFTSAIGIRLITNKTNHNYARLYTKQRNVCLGLLSHSLAGCRDTN